MKIIKMLRRVLGINLVLFKISLLEKEIIRLHGGALATTFEYDSIEHNFDEFEVNKRARTLIDLLQIQTPVGVRASRIGSEADGGYVFIEDFTKKDLFISAGIADDFNVDLQVVDQVGKLIMIDPSIDPVIFPQDNQQFIQRPLAPAANKKGISLEELLTQNNYSDAILKMDIEGAEWDILADLAQEKYKYFRQIVMEFHWLSNVNDNSLHQKKIETLTKLNHFHQIISIHVNNYGEYRIMGGVPIPDVVEVTYLRKSDYTFEPGFSNQVRALMNRNNPEKPEIEVWWA